MIKMKVIRTTLITNRETVHLKAREANSGSVSILPTKSVAEKGSGATSVFPPRVGLLLRQEQTTGSLV